jgi:hypothetical protein
VILNPFDARSAKWNLFAELRNAYDVDQLARVMIPDRGSSDTTWTSYARTYFSAVTRQAQTAGITDIGELYRLLTAAPRGEIRLLIDGTPAAPFLEEGSEKLFGACAPPRRITSRAWITCGRRPASCFRCGTG